MNTSAHGQPPQRVAPMRRAAWSLACLSAVAAAWPATAVAQAVQVDEPRAYGYFVGDTVGRTIRIDLPPGMAIDAGSLPQPGRRGKALELRSMAWRQGRELRLEYQVMLSPREPRVLEMPALELRAADAAGRAAVLHVEPWPVAVVPLVGVDAPSRRGFGDLQADRPPPAIDTSATRQRLMAYGVGVLLLSAYLLHVYVALPWWARHRRPFGQAWQRLQALPAEPDALQRRQAWAQVHAALNRTAGATLFEAGIERFVDEQPRYADLRAELRAFFDRSRRAFFAEEPAQDDLAWLLAFCRRCRDAERGAA